MKYNRLRVEIETHRLGLSRIRLVLQLGSSHLSMQTPGFVASAQTVEQLLPGLRAFATHFDADYTVNQFERRRPNTPHKNTPPPNIVESNRQAEELLEYISPNKSEARQPPSEGGSRRFESCFGDFDLEVFDR